MSASAAKVRYSERLYVTWWGWLLPLTAAVLIAAEVQMVAAAIPVWLPYVIAVALAAGVVVSLGRTAVRVTTASDSDGESELHVGDAHLPMRYVGEVEVVGKRDKRIALGPGLDPAAYVVHRGWVGPMVRVELLDEQDPTPYWLFSTRKPERVAEVLTSASGRDSTAG